MKPQSPLIDAILKKFQKLKQTGFVLRNLTKANAFHFVLDKTYRRFFTSAIWESKKQDKCF